MLFHASDMEDLRLAISSGVKTKALPGRHVCFAGWFTGLRRTRRPLKVFMLRGRVRKSGGC